MVKFSGARKEMAGPIEIFDSGDELWFYVSEYSSAENNDSRDIITLTKDEFLFKIIRSKKEASEAYRLIFQGLKNKNLREIPNYTDFENSMRRIWNENEIKSRFDELKAYGVKDRNKESAYALQSEVGLDQHFSTITTENIQYEISRAQDPDPFIDLNDPDKVKTVPDFVKNFEMRVRSGYYAPGQKIKVITHFGSQYRYLRRKDISMGVQILKKKGVLINTQTGRTIVNPDYLEKAEKES